MSTIELAEALSRHGQRAVQEAMTTALPFYWLRRADTLEAARPRPGDFVGQATKAQLEERDRGLAEAAAACREHAELVRRYPDAIARHMAEVVAAVCAQPAPTLGVAS